jgi:mRNA-degrading endonuclease RelE of RelBE toxin-antitoxin system
MAYQISITAEAESHRQCLTAHEHRILDAAIVTRLTNEPGRPTKAIKRLRPNPFADFELRAGNLRVLYNVDEENAEIVVLAIGRKVGNSLIVGGVEFHEHRSDFPESSADGPESGAE